MLTEGKVTLFFIGILLQSILLLGTRPKPLGRIYGLLMLAIIFSFVIALLLSMANPVGFLLYFVIFYVSLYQIAVRDFLLPKISEISTFTLTALAVVSSLFGVGLSLQLYISLGLGALTVLLIFLPPTKSITLPMRQYVCFLLLLTWLGIAQFPWKSFLHDVVDTSEAFSVRHLQWLLYGMMLFLILVNVIALPCLPKKAKKKMRSNLMRQYLHFQAEHIAPQQLQWKTACLILAMVVLPYVLNFKFYLMSSSTITNILFILVMNNLVSHYSGYPKGWKGPRDQPNKVTD